jgi:hypothetical protein
MGKYQFFSESDLDPKTGRVKSMYPAWYDTRMVQELEEDVLTREIALETGQVPRGSVTEFKENLEKAKEKLKKIQDMTLVDDAKNNKDDIDKIVTKLGKVLGEELPTGRTCEKNLVDSNMEYRKMTDKYLKVADENTAEFFKACNVEIKDGKVSREDMAVAWKIGTKFLGGYSNIEMLRK